MNKKTTDFPTKTSFLTCPLFSECGGCEVQSSFHCPPVFLEVQNFFLEFGVGFSLNKEKLVEWRMRAKLAVRGESSNPKIGLFKKGTHDIISIPNCPMHHPLINNAVKILLDCMCKHKITAYQEIFLTGDLRYTQFVVEEKSNKIQLTLVFNSKNDEVLKRAQIASFLQDLSKDDIWHSIWINCNDRASNAIFGDFWFLYFGEKFLKQKLLNREIYLHPSSFSQAHFSLFEKLVLSLNEKMDPQKRVVELYAGIGGIGFSVLDKSSSVICSEINPYAKECFEKTKSMLSENERMKISFHSLSAEDSVSFLRDCEVLIVDPPRKGVDRSVLEAISQSDYLEQIIYVSCYFSSFKRDVEFLKSVGWKMDFAEGYLLFPGTNQIEVLCILRKSG